MKKFLESSNIIDIVESLKREILELKELVKKLSEKIVLFEKENAEVKDKLGLNSTNSSLPPHQKIFTK